MTVHLVIHSPCPTCKRTSTRPLDEPDKKCSSCERKEAMMVNWCETCRGAKTTGWIPRWNWLIEEIRWSYPSLLKYVVKDIDCKACDGDGFAKPPGWPDEKEIERLRPKPPGSSGWRPRPSIGNFDWYDRPSTDPPPPPPPPPSGALVGKGCDQPHGIIKPVPPANYLVREGCTKPIQE